MSVPITLIVDDGAPVNLMYGRQIGRAGHIPRTRDESSSARRGRTCTMPGLAFAEIAMALRQGKRVRIWQAGQGVAPRFRIAQARKVGDKPLNVARHAPQVDAVGWIQPALDAVLHQ